MYTIYTPHFPLLPAKNAPEENPPGQSALVGQILLVGFDHLLRDVTRTTSEPGQIFVGHFAGKKFGLQR